MPLITGKSQASFKKNLATEIREGKPPKQAAAIAYAKQREAKRKDSGSDYRRTLARCDKAIRNLSSRLDSMETMCRKDAKLVARTHIPGGSPIKGKMKISGPQPNHY